jgi:hypothetical protein
MRIPRLVALSLMLGASLLAARGGLSSQPVRSVGQTTSYTTIYSTITSTSYFYVTTATTSTFIMTRTYVTTSQVVLWANYGQWWQGPAGQVSYVTMTVVTESPMATRTYYKTETRNLLQTTVVASTSSRVYYVEDDLSNVPTLLILSSLAAVAVLTVAIIIVRNRHGTRAEARFCIHCGTRILIGARICEKCGQLQQ